MPHLSVTGISEAWLLKECGHKHWLMLECAFERDSSQWHTNDGDRLYASFLATQTSGYALVLAGEGMTVHVDSSMERITSTVSRSVHRLSIAMECSNVAPVTAQVEMVAAFVCRKVGSSARLERPARTDWLKNGPQPTRAGLHLLNARRVARSATTDVPPALIVRLPVVPSEEFNAAGILYFANYHRFADRAEWKWVQTTLATAPAGAAKSRQLFYYDNLDIGDDIIVNLWSVDECGRAGDLQFDATLCRASDGQMIGRCATRRWRAQPHYSSIRVVGAE